MKNSVIHPGFLTLWFCFNDETALKLQEFNNLAKARNVCQKVQ